MLESIGIPVSQPAVAKSPVYQFVSIPTHFWRRMNIWRGCEEECDAVSNRVLLACGALSLFNWENTHPSEGPTSRVELGWSGYRGVVFGPYESVYMCFS